MNLERIGYVCLAVVGVFWLTAALAGVAAIWPSGWVAVLAVVGIGSLLAKVVCERRANVEDAYYIEHVER